MRADSRFRWHGGVLRAGLLGAASMLIACGGQSPPAPTTMTTTTTTTTVPPPSQPPVLTTSIVDLALLEDFVPFGSLSQGRLNPAYELRTTSVTAAVRAAGPGVVANILFNPVENDSEIHVRPPNSSEYMILYDHVLSLQVQVGQSVTAGQVLGTVGPFLPRVGRTQLQVNRTSGGTAEARCPREFGTPEFNAAHDAAFARFPARGESVCVTSSVTPLTMTDGKGSTRLLATAATYRSRKATDYAAYFGLSTHSWRKSTAESLFNVFGDSDALNLAPPRGPVFSAKALAPLAHFINCHGGHADPEFFGEKGNSQPVSLTSDAIAKKIKPGTVAAVECCYGAELYDSVTLSLAMPICQRYLNRGAYGYFGSSTIAYGPEEGNGAAEIHGGRLQPAPRSA